MKKISLKFKLSTKYGMNTFLSILLLLGIFVIIEALTIKNSKRLDLTENKRYSLSKQSKKLLKELPKKIRVTAFYRDTDSGKQSLNDLLKEYSHQSSKFSFEFIDPDRNPAKAKDYKITAYGTTVIEGDGKREKIAGSGEEDLTNAIIKVIREGKKVVYFLKGHGENDLEKKDKDGYSNVKEALSDSNYEVKELVLLRQEKVPEDASAVIVSGPKKELYELEIKALDNYIQNAGHILFMLDPYTAPDLVKYLDKYGIVVGNNIIIDKLSRLFAGDFFTPVVSQYENHKITRDFGVASFFPVTRSVEVKKDTGKKITSQILAKTGTDSWAETNKAELERGTASFNEGKDKKGPVSVAAVSLIDIKKEEKDEKELASLPPSPEEEKEKLSEKGKAKIVAFGDSDFASNAFLNLSGNRDFFLNTVNWLTEEESLISIRPKKVLTRPVVLTLAQGKLVFWLSVVVMPLIIIATGIVILVRRRLKK